MNSFNSLNPESDSVQISYFLDTINSAASSFWLWAHQTKLICFEGDLGAGKTTFIDELCNILGVKDKRSSPTFSLINIYETTDHSTVIHMDWYRINSAEEAVYAGLEDALHQNAKACFVEWAEKFPELLNLPHIKVTIEIEAETGKRILTAKKV